MILMHLRVYKRYGMYVVVSFRALAFEHTKQSPKTLSILDLLIPSMSLTRFFNEPFYSTADFDRLFDEAFHRNNPRGQVERQTNGTSFLRPRYDF